MTDTEKRLATLTAQLAMRGFVLARSKDDRGGPLYVISKWALTRQLHSLPELEAFVQDACGLAAPPMKPEN